MKNLFKKFIVLILIVSAFTINNVNTVKALGDEEIPDITVIDMGLGEEYSEKAREYDEKWGISNTQAAQEEARKKAEQERLAAEKAAEEARRKAEEERLAAEKAAEEARKKAEEEARKKAEEEARKKAEAEALEREKLNTGNSKSVSITVEEALKHTGNRNLTITNADIYDGVHSTKNYAGGVDETFDSTEIENLVFEKLNELRKSQGLSELKRIDAKSREWSQVMATTGLYEHAGLQKEYGVGFRLGYYEEYKGAGENIMVAKINSSLDAETIANYISNAWNNSPGHYSNRTNANNIAYDIAVVRSKNGAIWCTERVLIPGKGYGE